MSSFSCASFDMEHDYCMRLRANCVPGRPRRVLSKNSVFAVPVEQGIREKAEASERERDKQKGRK